MKYFISILVILFLSLPVDGSRRLLLISKPAAAGGGSPAWSDIEISANRDSQQILSATEYGASLVTAGQTGTATKLRIWIYANGDSVSHNVKLALYTSSGTLLDSGTVAVAASDDEVYKEVTISAAVTASTQYYIAFAGDDANLYVSYKAATGAHDIYTGKTYASFPENPLFPPAPTFDDLARNIVMGVYIEP